MASSMRLISSKLVTRSLISSSRFHSIHTGQRSYSTMPINDFYDQAVPRILCPKISSLSARMWMDGDDRDLFITIPSGSKETDIGLEVWLHEDREREKNMRPCVEPHTLLIETRAQKEKYEMLKVTDRELTSNIMANILVNDIFFSYRDITRKRCWDYYDMFFNQSILAKRFFPIIAMRSPISSFTVLKEESCKRLGVCIDMPGREKMKLTTQGLRVSLKMSGVKRKDVKTYFDYNTLFIEGKTKEDYYITGIHLPEDIHKKHNMIKRQMIDGVFYAFIACVKKK